jgi:hypothetical protein
MDTDVIQWCTRHYKNGAMPQQVPMYGHNDDAVRQVMWYRTFAQKAGVRNAAKAASNNGLPETLAVTILCRNILQAVEAYMKWELSEREFRFGEWEPDDCV